MIVVVGCLIVLGAVIAGFTIAGGHIGALLHPSELITIGGASLGAAIMMSPKKVLVDLCKGLAAAVKGTPYNRQMYSDLFRVMYDLLRTARKDGLLALDRHVNSPHDSEIINKYPRIAKNHHVVEFICGGLAPIVENTVTPEQLPALLETEIKVIEEEHHAPLLVLQKTADALPGFGIVAAVLGIVITMGAIDGPVEEIGHKVGAALVGTFLGILVAYGFVGPIASAMEHKANDEAKAFEVVKMALVASVRGYAPPVAVEFARKLLFNEVRPSFADLEAHLKGKAPPAKAGH
jgi:chemotaxis protein MotA